MIPRAAMAHSEALENNRMENENQAQGVPNLDQYFMKDFVVPVPLNPENPTNSVAENHAPNEDLIKFRTIQAGELHLTEATISLQNIYIPLAATPASTVGIEYALAQSEHFRTFNQSAGELVAFVRIILKPADQSADRTAALRWEEAKGYFEGRGERSTNKMRIDGGALQIADPKYVAEVESLFEQYSDMESFDDLIAKAADPSTNPPISFEYFAKTERSRGSRVNGFEAIDIDSGFGDGTYPIYAGYDADDVLAQIVCDFRLMDPYNWDRYVWKTAAGHIL
jgi:hypothetical protein